MDFVKEIEILKKEKKAVILAHYYTLPEVQDVADCLGDSLALAQYAEKTDAETIVFAGVHRSLQQTDRKKAASVLFDRR